MEAIGDVLLSRTRLVAMRDGAAFLDGNSFAATDPLEFRLGTCLLHLSLHKKSILPY